MDEIGEWFQGSEVEVLALAAQLNLGRIIVIEPYEYKPTLEPVKSSYNSSQRCLKITKIIMSCHRPIMGARGVVDVAMKTRIPLTPTLFHAAQTAGYALTRSHLARAIPRT